MNSEIDILAAEFVEPEMGQQFGSRAQVEVYLTNSPEKKECFDAILFDEKHFEAETDQPFTSSSNGPERSEITQEITLLLGEKTNELITIKSMVVVGKAKMRIREILRSNPHEVHVRASRKLEHSSGGVRKGRGR